MSGSHVNRNREATAKRKVWRGSAAWTATRYYCARQGLSGTPTAQAVNKDRSDSRWDLSRTHLGRCGQQVRFLHDPFTTTAWRSHIEGCKLRCDEGSSPSRSVANVARETCEAVRLMVFSSGGDNEVPKFVVGALCDLFGLARWWIRGDRGC